MLALDDIRNDQGIVDVAGVCPTSAKFTSLVTQAVRRMMNRGDWKGTVIPMQFCVRNGCLVMPRYVEDIRKLNACNRALPQRNLWYDFIPRHDWHCGQWHHHLHGDAALTAYGQSPVYQDVQGEGRLIRAYPRVQADIGKEVRIFGTDNNGQTLTTNNGDGTWSEGVFITLASPFGSTATFVRHIDRVLKAEMQGPVNLYAYHPATDLLEDLAQYDPGETNPHYARYKVNSGIGGGCSSGNCGTGLRSVAGLVKVKFIPPRFGSDLIPLDSLDVIKDAVMAIKLRDAGDLAQALQWEASAVREANRELENNSPEDKFTAENHIFAGRTFRNRAF